MSSMLHTVAGATWVLGVIIAALVQAAAAGVPLAELSSAAFNQTHTATASLIFARVMR